MLQYKCTGAGLAIAQGKFYATGQVLRASDLNKIGVKQATRKGKGSKLIELLYGYDSQNWPFKRKDENSFQNQVLTKHTGNGQSSEVTHLRF